MDNNSGCVLCRIASHSIAAEVLYENEEIMAFLDLYPATAGHILVIPKAHIENIYEMTVETGAKLMECAIWFSRAVKKGLHPDGLNLIQSNEVAGGQTIDHFHLHIVPRYMDDKVMLKFGHGSTPEDQEVLAGIAAAIKAAL